MIEIIVVIFLCRRLGRFMRAKGRRPLALQILLVLCWFGGEILGGIVFVIFQAIRGEPVDDLNLMFYAVALLGAACGAGLTFLLASIIPPAPAMEKKDDLTFGPAPSYGDSDNPYSPPSR